MKTLLVCSLIVVLILAAAIAHFRGGVAVMTAQEISECTAVESLHRMGIDGQHDALHGIPLAALARFHRIGAFAISRVGIDPATTLGLAISVFINWWLWIAGARTI